LGCAQNITFELATGGELFDRVLTVIRSVFDAADCLHQHNIVHRDLKYTFLFLSLYPLFRPENILYRSKDPDSDIVIADMCVRIHFLTPFAHLFTEQYPTPPTSSSSLSLALSATSHPKSSKALATENPSISGPQVLLLHTQTKHKLIALSLYSYPHLHSSLRPPLFRVGSITTFAQQNADPKIEFQSPILFLIKPDPLSDISSLSIIPAPLMTLYATLGLPPPPPPRSTRHFMPISPPL